MVHAEEVPEVSAFGSSWLLSATVKHDLPVVSMAGAELEDLVPEVSAFGEDWCLKGTTRNDRLSTPMAPVEQVPEVSAFGNSWLLSGSINDMPSIPTVQTVSVEPDIEGLLPEVMAFGKSWCLPENDRPSTLEEVSEFTSFGSSWFLSGSVNSDMGVNRRNISTAPMSQVTQAAVEAASPEVSAFGSSWCLAANTVNDLPKIVSTCMNEASKISPVKRWRSPSPVKETPCKQRRIAPTVTPPLLAQLRMLTARPDTLVSCKVSPGFNAITSNDEMASAAKHVVLSN